MTTATATAAARQPLERVERWYFAPAPAERLAAFRVLAGLFAVVYVGIRTPNLWGFADFSASRFTPPGVVSVLGRPLSAGLLHGLLIVNLALAFAFLAGWRYRFTGPAFAATLLVAMTYHDSFGQYFHTENLLVLHVIVLAVAPAADVWSLDARRTHRRPERAAGYGWPLALCATLTAIAYVLAGWAKIRFGGWNWLAGDSLRNHIAHDNLRKAVLGDPYSPIGSWAVRQPWLFAPFALGAMVVELGAPIALLGGRIRTAWVASAWVFHAGIFVFMVVLFPYPLSLVAFAPLFRVEQLGKWVLARRRSWLHRRRAHRVCRQPLGDVHRHDGQDHHDDGHHVDDRHLVGPEDVVEDPLRQGLDAGSRGERGDDDLVEGQRERQ